jgi:hypothetical protein
MCKNTSRSVRGSVNGSQRIADALMSKMHDRDSLCAILGADLVERIRLKGIVSPNF